MGLACDKWSWAGVHLCQIRFIYNIYTVRLCPRDYALNWKKKNYAPDITRNVQYDTDAPTKGHPQPHAGILQKMLKKGTNQSFLKKYQKETSFEGEIGP